MPKSNIKLDDGYIIGGGKKTKSGKDRIVPIHHKILPLIKYFYEKSNSMILLDVPYHIFAKNYKNIMDQIESTHTIHETRHTFASLLSRAEVSDSITKRLMGHSFQDITEDVYIHKSVEELRSGIEKIVV